MSFIYYLQQEAARCRRLAASVDDIDLSQRLHSLAEQFENRAAALGPLPGAGTGGRTIPFDRHSAASGRIARGDITQGEIGRDEINRATNSTLDRLRQRS